MPSEGFVYDETVSAEDTLESPSPNDIKYDRVHGEVQSFVQDLTPFQGKGAILRLRVGDDSASGDQIVDSTVFLDDLTVI